MKLHIYIGEFDFDTGLYSYVLLILRCRILYVYTEVSRPDMTFAVYWALKTNYLSVLRFSDAVVHTFLYILCWFCDACPGPPDGESDSSSSATDDLDIVPTEDEFEAPNWSECNLRSWAMIGFSMNEWTKIYIWCIKNFHTQIACSHRLMHTECINK